MLFEFVVEVKVGCDVVVIVFIGVISGEVVVIVV